MIYLLQQQLIQYFLYTLNFKNNSSSIINKHLERVVSALEWKQIIEYGKARIQSDYIAMQEKYIENIEKVLEKAAISHQQLKNRYLIHDLNEID